MPRKALTATSFAILAHLALRPWSAFELARQMRRGMDLIWSRAESAIYEEPKNLVEHGLAAARVEATGARRRTVYRITARGRRELRAWLATPSPPPQLDSEPLVRVFFAEHGDRESLLATIDAVEVFGRATRERLLAQIRGYLDEGGPFPERWHLIGIGSRFLVDYAELQERWARWARAEVERWPSTGADASREGPRILEETVARNSTTLRSRRHVQVGRRAVRDLPP